MSEGELPEELRFLSSNATPSEQTARLVGIAADIHKIDHSGKLMREVIFMAHGVLEEARKKHDLHCCACSRASARAKN